jgi:hypothetical protein
MWFEAPISGIWSLDVTGLLGSEYVPLVNDLARMLVLQLVLQLMVSASQPEEAPFFSAGFFVTLCYLLLAVCAFWLVFKKVVHIK